MTPDEFRSLALSFPEAAEASHMGHADFRVGGRIFATLGYPDARFAVLMLTPQDQDLIVRDNPRAFAPVAGKWGAGGSTSVALAELEERDSHSIHAALDAAWRRRAPKRLAKLAPAISAVHPVLMAHDVTESLNFYARLGFTTSFVDDVASPRYAGVRRDGVEIHLQWADETQWAHDGDRPAYRFEVAHVDALYAEFVAAGAIGARARVHAETESPWASPGDTAWGTREFHLRDPGGNVLQFYRSR